jgi:hypothetical protein
MNRPVGLRPISFDDKKAEEGGVFSRSEDEQEILAGGPVCVSRYFSISSEAKSSRKSAIRLQLRFPGNCPQKDHSPVRKTLPLRFPAKSVGLR